MLLPSSLSSPDNPDPSRTGLVNTVRGRQLLPQQPVCARSHPVVPLIRSTSLVELPSPHQPVCEDAPGERATHLPERLVADTERDGPIGTPVVEDSAVERVSAWPPEACARIDLSRGWRWRRGRGIGAGNFLL